MQSCGVCSRSPAPVQCKACERAFYCSLGCQKMAFKAHQPTCLGGSVCKCGERAVDRCGGCRALFCSYRICALVHEGCGKCFICDDKGKRCHPWHEFRCETHAKETRCQCGSEHDKSCGWCGSWVCANPACAHLVFVCFVCSKKTCPFAIMEMGGLAHTKPAPLEHVLEWTCSKACEDKARCQNRGAAVKAPPRPEIKGEDESCVVCMDAARTRVIVPCGHMVLCEKCPAATCPICRADVEQTVRVYKS